MNNMYFTVLNKYMETKQNIYIYIYEKVNQLVKIEIYTVIRLSYNNNIGDLERSVRPFWFFVAHIWLYVFSIETGK